MDNINKEWVFIVNPIAGNGYGQTIIPKLREMIEKHNVDAEIICTERSGHATELSEEYLNKGFRYIIAVGGDGTFNEMTRPLVNRKDITVGIIPAGTGNDFIQILGFPDRFSDKDWDIFFNRAVVGMDAGMCNGMIFLNGMGLGFDAQVAAENYTEPGKVKRGSKYKYIWHIIKTLLFFKEKRMTVISGGEKHESDCFINTIANGRRFAGGFYLTPKAISNDGLLDVCMIKKLSLPERFYILLKVPKGSHTLDKRVNYYQTRAIDIEFPEVVPFHVDGELYFSNKFEVTVLPEALQIIYNSDGNHFFRK
jgi:YegS/Rv2252/BmrU family lipid kinase